VTPPVIGLVGCGRWGANILRDLVDLGCEVAVADSDPAAASVASAAGACVVVDDVMRLPDVEGIVVASSTRSHGHVVAGALAHNVPIFVEKPLMTDVGGLEALALTAENRVFEMHKWRYHPGIEMLASVAGSGELGSVESLQTTRLGWVDHHHDVDPIWVLAPHDLSIAIEILAELPEPLAARVAHVDGVPVALTGLLGDAPWLTIDISGRSAVQRREVRLSGEGGTAVLPDSYSAAVIVTRPSSRGGSHTEYRPIDQEAPLRRELRCFAEYLTGGDPPRSALSDSIAVARSITALRALAAAKPVS
jgi:predicted dehydrogenase